jgi:hypothetical protein
MESKRFHTSAMLEGVKCYNAVLPYSPLQGNNSTAVEYIKFLSLQDKREKVN